jgi:hypothetical protein
MQVPVRVAGETVIIEVYQKSKTVWEASGDYKGHPVTVTKGSRAAVIAHWCYVADRGSD